MLHRSNRNAAKLWEEVEAVNLQICVFLPLRFTFMPCHQDFENCEFYALSFGKFEKQTNARYLNSKMLPVQNLKNEFLKSQLSYLM